MSAYANITLEMVYQKLLFIEETVREIDNDLHRLKPEFIQKIKKIEEEDVLTFNTIEDMEKHLDKAED